MNSILLANALKREANNFDLLRLICACLVIYGHAFVVSPEPGKADFFYTLTGYYSGEIAVKLFFFLSGIFVTVSLVEKKSVVYFVISRFFRIWPALIFVVVCSALVIGPAFTKLNLVAYLRDPNTLLYIKHQVSMNTFGTQQLGYYDLPGLFTENHYKNNVNASLWSLGIEVYAYLLLAAVYLAGLLTKKISILLFILVALDSVLPTRIVFTFLPQGYEDFSYLPFCFACGALVAMHKESLTISASQALCCLLFYYLFLYTPYERYFFYASLFSGSLYIFTRAAVLRLRPPVDISYGVYLWGFPVQQMLDNKYPLMSTFWNLVLGIFMAILFGIISWYLVEERSIAAGKKISKYLHGILDNNAPSHKP